MRVRSFSTATEVDLAMVAAGAVAGLLLTDVPSAADFAPADFTVAFPGWNAVAHGVETCAAGDGGEVLPTIANYTAGALAGRLILSTPTAGGEFACYKMELLPHQFDALRGEASGLSWRQAGPAEAVVEPHVSALIITRASRLVGIRPARGGGSFVAGRFEFFKK